MKDRPAAGGREACASECFNLPTGFCRVLLNFAEIAFSNISALLIEGSVLLMPFAELLNMGDDWGNPAPIEKKKHG